MVIDRYLAQQSVVVWQWPSMDTLRNLLRWTTFTTGIDQQQHHQSIVAIDRHVPQNSLRITTDNIYR